MSAFVVRIRRGEPPLSSSEFVLHGRIRLDDRDTLRSRLRDAGVKPDSDTHAALVLAAYRAWGERMLDRILGDFAFALWDPTRRVLFCARDPFGVKPFYYAAHAAGFVASDAMSAVRAEPGLGGALDEASIVSFLRWGYTVDLAATSFAAIRRLPPGHTMIVDATGVAGAPRRWWHFPDPPPLRLGSDAEYLEAMREVAGAAVRDRLSGPRGAILMSGGVDSTGLAAAARRYAPGVEVTAFTIDESNLGIDTEIPLARMAASALGIRHEIVVDHVVPYEHLDDPSITTPEPHDHCEFGAWRRLAARVAARSPVLMIGEDGDSLFRPPSPLRMARRWGALQTAARLVHFIATRRRKPHTGLWLRDRVRALYNSDGDGSMPSWVRPDVIARTGTQDGDEDRTHPARPETAGRLTAPVWQSMLERSEPEYSGSPLHVVWPLIDLRVLNFALALPPIPWLQQKEIWREAWRGALPHEVVNRPKSSTPWVAATQLANWRGSARDGRFVWNQRTADFVDTQRAGDMLQSDDAYVVLDAWRAMVLDRWLRSAD